MIERPQQGLFITFEGPDGSGKSTQMRILAERLENLGHDTVQTQEPGGTDVGRAIRGILLDEQHHRLCPIAEMLLYFAARAQNFDEVILPAWSRGSIVLSDRFTDSTLAYQGIGRGLGPNVVMQLHDIACHGLQPDLTICIDLDPASGLARIQDRGRDRMEQQAADFYQRVRDAYHKLAEQEPERVKIVDGHGSISDVSERVWEVVQPCLRTTTATRR